MVVSKKSLGVIVLLFIPCFAAGQNCKTVVNSSIDYLLSAKSKD